MVEANKEKNGGRGGVFGVKLKMGETSNYVKALCQLFNNEIYNNRG